MNKIINKMCVFTKANGLKHRQIEISQVSDWKLFEIIGNNLINNLNGKWKGQLDGLDERYWDLDVNGLILTLHLSHYLGITLYYNNEIDDESTHLLEKAYQILSYLKSAQQGDAPEPASPAR